jgi:hypothetical protein
MENAHFEEEEPDRKIAGKWTIQEDGKWIELAQDRAQWSLVSMLAVMNLRVLPQELRISPFCKLSF